EFIRYLHTIVVEEDLLDVIGAIAQLLGVAYVGQHPESKILRQICEDLAWLVAFGIKDEVGFTGMISQYISPGSIGEVVKRIRYMGEIAQAIQDNSELRALLNYGVSVGVDQGERIVFMRRLAILSSMVEDVFATPSDLIEYLDRAPEVLPIVEARFGRPLNLNDERDMEFLLLNVGGIAFGTEIGNEKIVSFYEEGFEDVLVGFLQDKRIPTGGYATLEDTDVVIYSYDVTDVDPVEGTITLTIKYYADGRLEDYNPTGEVILTEVRILDLETGRVEQSIIRPGADEVGFYWLTRFSYTEGEDNNYVRLEQKDFGITYQFYQVPKSSDVYLMDQETDEKIARFIHTEAKPDGVDTAKGELTQVATFYIGDQVFKREEQVVDLESSTGRLKSIEDLDNHSKTVIEEFFGPFALSWTYTETNGYSYRGWLDTEKVDGVAVPVFKNGLLQGHEEDYLGSNTIFMNPRLMNVKVRIIDELTQAEVNNSDFFGTFAMRSHYSELSGYWQTITLNPDTRGFPVLRNGLLEATAVDSIGFTFELKLDPQHLGATKEAKDTKTHAVTTFSDFYGRTAKRAEYVENSGYTLTTILSGTGQPTVKNGVTVNGAVVNGLLFGTATDNLENTFTIHIDSHHLGATVKAEDEDTNAVTESSDFYGRTARYSMTLWPDGYWAETTIHEIDAARSLVKGVREDYFGIIENIDIDPHHMGAVIWSENRDTKAESVYGDAAVDNEGFFGPKAGKVVTTRGNMVTTTTSSFELVTRNIDGTDRRVFADEVKIDFADTAAVITLTVYRDNKGRVWFTEDGDGTKSTVTKHFGAHAAVTESENGGLRWREAMEWPDGGMPTQAVVNPLGTGEVSTIKNIYTDNRGISKVIYRDASGFEVRTLVAGRRIDSVFDYDAFTAVAQAFDTATKELIVDSRSEFDPATKTWHKRNVVWFSHPRGLQLRVEEEELNPYGKFLRGLIGDEESIPEYDNGGAGYLETARDILKAGTRVRRFENYNWEAGRCSKDLVDNEKGITLRLTQDTLGRSIGIGINFDDILRGHTTVTYRSATERATRARKNYNGGRTILEYRYGAATADGLVPVKVFALPHPESEVDAEQEDYQSITYYPITDDYYARFEYALLKDKFENTYTFTPQDWDTTDRVLEAEVVDEFGNPKKRIEVTVGSQVSPEGLPLSIVETYELYPDVEVNVQPLMRNGTPFRIYGVNVPDDYRRLYAEYINLMVDLGANTGRVFRTTRDIGILDAFDRAGIVLIPTFGYDATDTPDRFVQRIVDYVTWYTNNYKTAGKDPVLLWCIGNEETNKGEQFYGKDDEWQKILQRTAAAIHAIDSSYQVTTAHAGVPEKTFVDGAPDVDVWGGNVYEWYRPAGALYAWNSISDKPWIFTEVGPGDALDNRSGLPLLGPRDEQGSHAFGVDMLYRQLYALRRFHSGACFFELADEWNKAGNPGVQDSIGAGFINPGAYPDNFANEEWWGLVARVVDAAGNVTFVYRPAFNVLKDYWRNRVPVPDLEDQPLFIDAYVTDTDVLYWRQDFEGERTFYDIWNYPGLEVALFSIDNRDVSEDKKRGVTLNFNGTVVRHVTKVYARPEYGRYSQDDSILKRVYASRDITDILSDSEGALAIAIRTYDFTSSNPVTGENSYYYIRVFDTRGRMLDMTHPERIDDAPGLPIIKTDPVRVTPDTLAPAGPDTSGATAPGTVPPPVEENKSGVKKAWDAIKSILGAVDREIAGDLYAAEPDLAKTENTATAIAAPGAAATPTAPAEQDTVVFDINDLLEADLPLPKGADIISYEDGKQAGSKTVVANDAGEIETTYEAVPYQIDEETQNCIDYVVSWLRAQGFNELADDVAGSDPYEIKPMKEIAGEDEETELLEIKQWITFRDPNTGLESMQINEAEKRIRFILHDDDENEVGSFDHYWEDCTIGELLGIGIFLDETGVMPREFGTLRKEGFTAKYYLVWDVNTKNYFVEVRNKPEFGILEEIYQGEYKGDYAINFDLLKHLQSTTLSERSGIIANIDNGFLSESLEILFYADFLAQGRASYSRPYLRLIEVSRYTLTFLTLPDRTLVPIPFEEALINPLYGEIQGTGAVSVSRLYDLKIERQADGSAKVRIISLRHDAFTFEQFVDENGEIKEVVLVDSDKLEVKDGRGDLIEKWFIHLDENGNPYMLPGDLKVYFFYNGTYGRYGIGDYSLTTVVNDAHQEDIFTFAELSELYENGNLRFKVLQGKGHVPGLMLSVKDNGTYNYNHDVLEQHAVVLGDNGKDRINIVWRDTEGREGYERRYWEEIKDNRGRLRVLLTGQLTPGDEAYYITFLDYGENGDTGLLQYAEAGLLHMGITLKGYAYQYVSGQDEYEYYLDREMIALADNLRFKDQSMLYDIKDGRPDRRGVSIMALHLDGRIAYQDYTGIRGPRLIRLYFDNYELPTRSTIRQDALGVDLSEEVPYAKYKVYFDNANPRQELVVEITTHPGYVESWTRFVKKHDRYGLPAALYLPRSLFINGNLIWVDDNRDQKFYEQRLLPVWGPYTLEGLNRVHNNVIGKHIRVLVNEDIPRAKALIKGEPAQPVTPLNDPDLGKDEITTAPASSMGWTLLLIIAAIVAPILLIVILVRIGMVRKVVRAVRTALVQGILYIGTHQEILNQIIARLQGSGECTEAVLDEIFDQTYAAGFKAMVRRESNGRVLERLCTKEVMRTVCTDIRNELDTDKKLLGNRRDLANEIFIRTVEAVYRRQIEDILAELGFDKTVTDSWMFDGFIPFKRKDGYIWHGEKDIFENVVCYIVHNLRERLINGYDIAYTDGKSPSDVYMKVERLKSYRFKDKNGFGDIPAAEWTGWIDVPLERSVEELIFKFCQGALSNNAEYSAYLRYISDTYRSGRRHGKGVRDIIPHVVLSAAVFSKMLSKELFDKHELRTIRSNYENTPDTLNDVTFPLWLQICRNPNGTYEHPLRRIELDFFELQYICEGVLQDTEAPALGEDTELLKTVRALLKDDTFTFASLETLDHLGFKHLWAIITAIDKVYGKEVCSYVVQDIVRRCILPLVFERADENLNNHNQRYPMKWINLANSARLLVEYITVKTVATAAVFALIFAVKATGWSLVYLMTVPVIIMLIGIAKALFGQPLRRGLTKLSRGKQGLIDFAIEQAIRYLRRENVDCAWEFAKEDGRAEHMRTGMRFFAQFLYAVPRLRELVTAYIAVRTGHEIAVALGLLLAAKYITMVIFLILVPIALQAVLKFIAGKRDYSWNWSISYPAYAVSILFFIIGIFGIPFVKIAFMLAPLQMILLIAAALVYVGFNVVLMPKVVTPIGMALMTSRLFNKTRRFLIRGNSHIQRWADSFVFKTTKASLVGAIILGVLSILTAGTSVFFIHEGLRLFAAASIVATLILLAWITHQLQLMLLMHKFGLHNFNWAGLEETELRRQVAALMSDLAHRFFRDGIIDKRELDNLLAAFAGKKAKVRISEPEALLRIKYLANRFYEFDLSGVIHNGLVQWEKVQRMGLHLATWNDPFVRYDFVDGIRITKENAYPSEFHNQSQNIVPEQWRNFITNMFEQETVFEILSPQLRDALSVLSDDQRVSEIARIAQEALYYRDLLLKERWEDEEHITSTLNTLREAETRLGETQYPLLDVGRKGDMDIEALFSVG
ncbi:hypothetical protein ACFL38_04770, partial [Candidatus Omnitrophota bacterium]